VKTKIVLSLSILLSIAAGCLNTTYAQNTGTPILKGVWEGVINAPRRPLVVATDFSSNTARLDATGSSSWTIANLSSKGEQIQFQITLAGQSPFQFEGLLRENEIRGNVRVGDQVLPFWLEPLPVLPTPRDKVEAWQQDLDDVIRRFFRYDRSFSSETRAAFRDRIATLRQALQNKSDQEIMVELARAVAISGNAHTRLYLIRNRTEVRRLPIRVWWFKDQLHIVRATQEQSSLLGCRVIKIGTLDIREAASRVRRIKAGNDSWQRYMSTYFLTSSDLLFGAHVIPNPEQTAVTVKCGSESRVVQLAPLPLRRATTPVEAWWDLVPESRDENTAFIPALRADIAPLYLRNTRKNYWHEYIPQYRAIYVQYNRSQQAQGGPTINQFTDTLVREVDQRKPAALIFDLRFNTGGDLTVGTPLMRTVADKFVGVPLFVITGRTTFSAGITHVVQLKQWARATIVGEPVGDELDTWSEGGNLILPNSKLTVHYANAAHAYSKREYPDRRPYVLDLDVDSVAPDVRVETSWTDYIKGRDPALEAIAKRIRVTQN
jgi:hypothetical protein